MILRIYIFISLIILFFCIEIDFNIIYRADDSQFINLIDDIYLETELSLGSNGEKFKVAIDISNYCIVVPGKELPVQNIKIFNKTTSTSFSEKGKLAYIYDDNIFSGIIGEDKMQLGDLNNRLDFVVCSEYSTFSTNNDYYTYVGLNLNTMQINLKGLNILEQLKNKTLIDKQVWYLEFNDYNKGKLFLGKFPHEINSEKYNGNNSYSTYYDLSYGNSYRIKFDEIFYGKNERKIKMEDHDYGILSLNTRLIHSPDEFGQMIYKNFFSKKIEDKICYSDKFRDNYIYFYCEKDKIDISEMDNLNFVLKETEMVFEFTPQDLFYEHNNYLYYLVVYKQLTDYEDKNKDIEWALGLQFLQKYTIASDISAKNAYYYKTEKENEGKGGSQDKDENGNSVKYIVIICLLIFIFICIVGFLIFYIMKIRPRKIKANELDENYDYESAENKKGIIN